jgi:hypothetical protein
MPLSKVKYPYVESLVIPSLLAETNTVSGNSLFNGNAIFRNGINVTAGNSVFSGPLTGSSGFLTTDLLATGQATVGTATPLAQLTVIPNASTTRGLQIRGAVGQTADYLRIENSAATQLLTVASSGALTLVGDVLHNLNNGRFNNISSLWFNSPNTMGTGSIHGYFPAFFIEATGYSPFLIRSQVSSNEARKDAISIISNATNNPPIFQISSTGEISSRSSNRVPLNVRGVRNTGVYRTDVNTIFANGSTVTYDTGTVNANMFEVGATVTITGASTAGFNGTFTIASSTNSDFTVSSTATGTSSTATATSVGHTADLVRYTNSANTVVGGINALAQPYTGSTTTANTQVGGAVTAGSHNGTIATLNLTSAPNLAVGDQIVVSGFTPAGYNGRHIVTAVSNTPTFSVSYATPNPGATSVLGIVSAPAQDSIFARSAGTIGQIIRGAASQVSDLQVWQNSTPATVASMSPSGSLTLGAALNLNYATPAITSNNASAASIFTSTVTGVTIGSSTIKTTNYPVAPTGTTSGTVTQAAQLSGYIGMPQNAQIATGTFTYPFVASDAGKHIYVTGTPSSATLTIPANSAVAFEIGTTFVVMNDLGAATNISIGITTDTLQLAGTGTTGSRTLARYGVASITKVTSTKWIISGNGLT